MERVIGKISRRDLAVIFARAAELTAERKLEARDLGRTLMDQVMGQAKQKQPDESASASDRLPAAGGGNLADLSKSVEDLTKTLELDPRELPEPPPAPRGRTGVMGLQTLEELFVREGQVRFDGYMEDIEQQLVETFENFKAVSWEFGISARDFERGDVLGEGSDLLESRRASRLAEQHSSGRIASMPLMEAAQKQPVITQVDADTLRALCACGVQRQLYLPELPRLRVRCSTCRQVLYTPAGSLGQPTASMAAQLHSPGSSPVTLRVIYDPHQRSYLAPESPQIAPGDRLRLEGGHELSVDDVRAEEQGGRTLQRVLPAK